MSVEPGTSTSTSAPSGRLHRNADGILFYDGQRVYSTLHAFDDSIALLLDGPALRLVSRAEWDAVHPPYMFDHPLAQALSPLERSQLECDGLSTAIATVLRMAGVPYTPYAGQLVHLPTETLIPHHFWLVLATGEIVDFCARMWLGGQVDVPHGIFVPGDYPAVQYHGSLIAEQCWTEVFFSMMTGQHLPDLVTAVQQLRQQLSDAPAELL